MATYKELKEIYNDEVGGGGHDLYELVRVACGIASEIIVSGDDTGGPWDPTGHAQRLKWVDAFLADQETISRQVFLLVLAANESASQSAILQATDSTIQSNVNSFVDALAANLP